MKLSWQQSAPLLWRYSHAHWRNLALLALLLGSDIALQLLGPQIVRSFIDRAMSGAALSTLLGAGILFLGVALLQQGAAVGTVYVGESVGWRATNELRADLFAHTLHLDMSFHQHQTPGELIERIDGDVSELSTFFSQFVVQVLGNLLLLLGILALLYREDWRIGLLFTLFVWAALYTFRRIEGQAAPHWAAARGASADLYGFVEERLSGLDDLRANGALPATLHHFFQNQRTFFTQNRQATLMAYLLSLRVNLLLTGGTIAALALGVYLWQHNLLTLGGVYLITQYSRLLLGPLNALNLQVDDLQKVGGSLTRIFTLLQTPQAVQSGPSALSGVDALAIEFDRVTFQYPAAKVDGAAMVLHDLSFQLAPGRVLGLLGRTGSGKSTITRLLFRLYDPSAGVIRLNGIPLTTLDVASLRHRIGLVTQDVQLFEGTLRDNLTFFDPTIGDEHLHTAIHKLGLGEWLAQLPAGLETSIGAGGQGLSAGEAQLLAFTRVFLKDVGLVILDEASARLDPATERLIKRAVDRLLHQRTAIIIAHRLATVQRVDEILILEKGHIREQGERTRLAADSTSYYAKLLATDLQEVLP